MPAKLRCAHLSAVCAPVSVLLKPEVFQVAVDQVLLQLSKVSLKDLQESFQSEGFAGNAHGL